MKEYEAALTFWNNYFTEQKAEKLEEASIGFGCAFLEEKLKELATLHHVLDFGCGTGWASLYLKQMGCNQVTGIDQAANAIQIAQETAELSELTEGLSFINSDENYLMNLEDNTYDGFFTSNTIDVIPTQISLTILKQVQRICKPDAKIYIMINPYLTEELNNKIQMKQIENNCYTKDGVLRCVNMTKDEWIHLLSDYFVLEQYDEFECDDEPKGLGRRMFSLRNRK